MRIGTARGVAVAAAIAGTAAVAVVARSSPTHPFVALKQTTKPLLRSISPVPTASSSGSPSPSATSTHTWHATNWIAVAIILLVIVTFVYGVFDIRIRLARHAEHRGMRVGAPANNPADTPPAELTAGIDAIFAALERGPASDAVIACWLRVEAAAATAGVRVGASETSAEFVDRVLVSYGVREEPLRRLAALYREARFSSHPMPERSRQAARDCLDDIRQSLGGVRAQR